MHTQTFIGTLLVLVMLLAWLEYKSLQSFARQHIANNSLCAVALRDASTEYVVMRRMGYSARETRANLRAYILKRYGIKGLVNNELVRQASIAGIKHLEVFAQI
jgi:hypothetical protein